MDTNKDITLIEQYLNQELSTEERQAFEVRLEQDETFANEFDKHQMAHKALDFLVAKNLKAKLESLEKEEAKTAAPKIVSMQSRGRRMLLMRIAAAAMVILTVGLFYFYFPTGGSSGRELAAAYYEPDLSMRGGTNNPEDTLQLGIVAIENGDYQGAISLLNTIPPSNSYSLQAQYFKAHALYLSEDYDQAENEFSQVSTTTDIRYQQEAEWYSLLSCLAQNKDCKNKLNAIAQNNNHNYHQEAQRILEEMK